MEKCYDYFCSEKKRIINKLEKNNIGYKFHDGKGMVSNYLTFTLDEEQKNIMKFSSLFISFSETRKYYKYTQCELDQYAYYIIRSVNADIEFINIQDFLASDCSYKRVNGTVVYNHQYQAKSFKIDRYNKKKAKYIFEDNFDRGYTFVSDEFKKLMEENRISGFKYDFVYKKNDDKYDNLFQLHCDNIISLERISYLKGGKETFCKHCGRKMIFEEYSFTPIVIAGSLSEDVYETEDFCGAPSIVISKKVYDLLKINKMLKGCYITPVIISKVNEG